MPLIEKDYHQPLSAQGYRALAVHVGDSVGNAVSSAMSTGITFPEIIDFDSSVLQHYSRVGEGVDVFPLAYLVDRSGVIRHIYTQTEPPPATLMADVQALLSE